MVLQKKHCLVQTMPPTLRIPRSPPLLVAVRRWDIRALNVSDDITQTPPLVMVSKHMNLASEVGLAALVESRASVGGIAQLEKQVKSALLSKPRTKPFVKEMD